MSEHRAPRGRKTGARSRPSAELIVAPPIPPVTEKEKALDAEILERMRELTEILIQNNLDAAVALAQQAARREGPLVEHFAEMGRRFCGELRPKPKERLRVIEGGLPTASKQRGDA